jgi:hypothetical protein
LSRKPPRRTRKAAAKQSSPSEHAPRVQLRLAAEGERCVLPRELTGMLADHLLEADAQAKELAKQRGLLLRMLTEDSKKDAGNLIAALDAIAKIDGLQRSMMSELRKTTELLWRMSGPARPTLVAGGSGRQRATAALRSI